jgi:uncharacterized FlgJ-related protein
MLYIYNKKRLSFKKVPLILITLIGIGFLSVIYFLIKDKETLETKIIEYEKSVLVLKLEEDKFTKTKFLTKLKEWNIKFPDIVYAQAIIESGNFGSFVFKENNNMFGMKLARIRPTTALGLKHNHAYYEKWQHSLLDYALYQSYYLDKIRTREEYLDYLCSNYAEATHYCEAIERTLKQIEKDSEYKEIFKK